MPYESPLENENGVPDDSPQPLRRLMRFAARNGYLLVGNILVSSALVTAIIFVGAFTPKDIKDRNDLRREGRVTYTNDVHVGGRRDATVFYTFTYDQKSYSGKAFLPSEYLDKVRNYSKSGDFPVQFLPMDPSINHPNDWIGNGPTAILLPILVAILAIQLSRLAWFAFDQA